MLIISWVVLQVVSRFARSGPLPELQIQSPEEQDEEKEACRGKRDIQITEY